MKRLLFLTATVLALAIGIGAQSRPRDDNPNISFRARFNVVEATIPDMQAALASGTRHIAASSCCSTCPASRSMKIC